MVCSRRNAKGARLETAKHGDLPWRIGEVAPDFKLLDAWALPAGGTLDEFADLIEMFATLDPSADYGAGPRKTVCAPR